jgi:polyhydroxyalkanoate synthase subunit PhaE
MDMFDMLSRRMAEAPALAKLWDTDRKLLASTLAFGRWQQAQAEVARAMDGATRDAQATFAERLKERSVAASENPRATPPMMNDAFDQWLAVLNEAMLGTMREAPYLAAQRRLVESGLAFRESLAALADEACDWFQLPSRTDFDDLARSVTELRRELRALKRSAAPAAKPPNARPARKTRESAR